VKTSRRRQRRNQMPKQTTMLVSLSAGQMFKLLTKGEVISARAGVFRISLKKGKKEEEYIVPIGPAIVDQVVPEDKKEKKGKKKKDKKEKKGKKGKKGKKDKKEKLSKKDKKKKNKKNKKSGSGRVASILETGRIRD